MRSIASGIGERREIAGIPVLENGRSTRRMIFMLRVRGKSSTSSTFSGR